MILSISAGAAESLAVQAMERGLPTSMPPSFNDGTSRTWNRALLDARLLERVTP